MSRARHHIGIRPRVVADRVLAAYLGRSLDWLREHRRQLETDWQFPKRLPAVVGGTDLDKVDDWLDRLPSIALAAPEPAMDPQAEEIWRQITGQVEPMKRSA